MATTRNSCGPYLAAALLGALAACGGDDMGSEPGPQPPQPATAGSAAVVGGGPVAGASVVAGAGGTPAMSGGPGGGGAAGIMGAAGTMSTAGAGTAAPPVCGSTSPDGDGDGTPDCMDMCAMDRAKTAPGMCGCGMPDTDANMNGTPDCMDMTEPEPVDPDACKVGPIPADVRAEYELDAFYTRYASADGTPIVATDKPVDESISRACRVVLDLSSEHPMARERMRSDHIYFIMMAKTEKTVQTPEYRSRGDLDARARGFGNNPGLCAEENVMCEGRPADRWGGESICVHEYSHVMHLYVWNRVAPMFDQKVNAAYTNAVRTMRLYGNTYAASNAVEYFAEGVQNWYNTNLQSPRGEAGDGVHNHINTRAELKEYDPMLYDLLATVLPDVPAYKDCYYYE